MRRWPYLVLFFVNAIAAGILVAYGQDLLRKVPQLRDHCDVVQQPYCIDNQTIFRASKTMSIFFLILMCWSAMTETGYSRRCAILGLELPLYVGLIVGSFFVPNRVFEVYAWIAAVLSAIFILLQIVILLDCVYDIRDYLLDKINQVPGSRLWPFIYLAASIGAWLASIAGLVLLFIYYSGAPLAIAFMVITSIFVLIFPIIGANDKIGAGLLPPAAMTMYLVFLCWQSIIKVPHASKLDATAASTSAILVPSAIIGAVTVSWTSWRTTESTNSLFRLDIVTTEPQVNTPVAPNDDGISVNPAEETPQRVVAPSWQFFFIMFFSSFYMAMVMTNWGMDSGSLSEDTETISIWVQICSQWATALLFVWTLVAPLVFPNRDFS
ncbi:hypothetical protein Ae201684P_004315 [Aphanomyces euteiches]|uniref:Uncharacterized protein n=1 Tax=Aphanomyces euteiches TaxID=100861 RepID=A0A6G0XCZ7_9STRA|nr:hypothetical protein Ae201684_006074 [Aphanomyces euteiches]KAH9068613.1 hypothetical protein Ae201684P_004315 [Aphanomyces euteiches]KAH9153895.1 hypothetical protein AeRB84_003937 [Aphanomyces euteiches]